MKISDALIQELPKTDLHVHLDGSLRLHTIMELAREQGVELPADTERGMRELVFKERYANLGEYLSGFQYTCAILQDEVSLERVAYELAWDNIHEGVRYIEARFAPQLHTEKGLTLDQIFLAVNRGLRKAQNEYEASSTVVENGEPPFRYGIIACALRMFTKDTIGWYGRFFKNFHKPETKHIFGQASLELARNAVRCRDQYQLPIVGLDLAGQEEGYPARHHKFAFNHAHKYFLNRTVHAGEAYGPESILDAITVLHADRIGHGYHLFSPEKCEPKVKEKEKYTRRIIDYIASRRITIEVCISSNLQTNPSIGKVEHHHFGKMLDEQISATICTDNRLISNTCVSKELRLAIDAFDMSPRQLRNVLIYGFKRSFFPGSYRVKREYVRSIIDYAEKVFQKHGIEL